jgi:hypothetical protein
MESPKSSDELERDSNHPEELVSSAMPTGKKLGLAPDLGQTAYAGGGVEEIERAHGDLL